MEKCALEMEMFMKEILKKIRYKERESMFLHLVRFIMANGRGLFIFRISIFLETRSTGLVFISFRQNRWFIKEIGRTIKDMVSISIFSHFCNRYWILDKESNKKEEKFCFWKASTNHIPNGIQGR